jgi:nicotinate-nucleotide adenylyltransferase
MYGGNIDKAYLAGLLHDITKNFSRDQHLKIIEEFDIILSDIEKNSQKLWHAITGSVYAKKFLKIDDPEIVSAIRYHTTAKENMSHLEKILYLADFTSADRNYPDVDVMRKLVDCDMDSAMLYALEYTVNDLHKNGLAVHPDTLMAYSEYKEKCKRGEQT